MMVANISFTRHGCADVVDEEGQHWCAAPADIGSRSGIGSEERDRSKDPAVEANLELPWWSNVSGPCKSYGGCVQSPGYPAAYGENQSCIINVSAPVRITAFHFATGHLDVFSVDGVEYSGHEGPIGVVATTGIGALKII